MFRKSFFGIAAVAVLVFASGMTAYAQIAITSGTVELVQADGTRVPVANANIDVYRTDSKAGFPKGKTDKRGGFNFAGFVIGGVYALAVSAPNCAPNFLANVKAGQEKLLISLRPGDGRQLTEAEVREAVAKGGKAGAVDAAPDTSAADKAAAEKAKAEYDAKVAEINEKNKKSSENYDKINVLLKEGSEAVKAKNYDLAVAKYDEGITIEPNFVGSTPVLLNNRGTSLRLRAVETYNKAVKLTDATEKVDGYAKARKDILDAVESHLKSWKIATETPAAEIKDVPFNDNNKLVATREVKEAFRIAVVTEQVDPGVIEVAKVMIPQYITLELDAAKKAEAMLIMADLYRVTADSPNAIIEYKKILETTPENPDALAGLGLSLVNEGYVKDDKAMLQEAANYLQKFVSVAPDTHKYKANAVEAIDTLKKLSNVAPQKPAAGGKKKP